jgi:hypothetical protein
MLDPKTQAALDNLKTFELKPLTTDQLNGLTTVDLSAFNASSTLSITGGVQGASGQYMTSGTAGNYTWQTPNVWTTTGTASAIGTPMTVHQRGLIELQGEDADIKINGKSMSAWMARVEERLNILTPNPELEKDWDDLRKLGERYRRLEKKCKEKAETWNKLKAMPPPAVD